MSPEPEASLCVLCRKRPVEPRWRPFCSERCKLHDLAKWADGTYSVAADPVTSDPEVNPGRDQAED